MYRIVLLHLLLTATAMACEFPGLSAEADRALHAGSAEARSASADASAAVVLEAQGLYAVALLPMDSLHGLHTAGRAPDAARPYGGLVSWQVSQPGLWRIALSEPAWVDVVVNGAVLTSVRHGGERNCHRPHKVVDFRLEDAGRAFIQLRDSPVVELRMSLRRLDAP